MIKRPASTTTSLVLRPFAANLAVIFCKESNGDCICRLVAVRFAVVPSLLPKGTAQYGTPTCNQKQNSVNWKQSECRTREIMQQYQANSLSSRNR